MLGDNLNGRNSMKISDQDPESLQAQRGFESGSIHVGNDLEDLVEPPNPKRRLPKKEEVKL